MSPDRIAKIKSLKEQLAFERNFKAIAYSKELKAEILEYLKTCESQKHGCKLIGFSFSTVRNWNSEMRTK